MNHAADAADIRSLISLSDEEDPFVGAIADELHLRSLRDGPTPDATRQGTWYRSPRSSRTADHAESFVDSEQRLPDLAEQLPRRRRAYVLVQQARTGAIA